MAGASTLETAATAKRCSKESAGASNRKRSSKDAGRSTDANEVDRLALSWTADRKASVPKLATRTREPSDICDRTESGVSPDRRASPNANPATGAAIPAGIKRIPTLTKNPPTSLTEHDLPRSCSTRFPGRRLAGAPRSPLSREQNNCGNESSGGGSSDGKQSIPCYRAIARRQASMSNAKDKPFHRTSPVSR